MDFALDGDVANPTSPITLQNVRQFDRPVQDEWGLFDPQQAGLEALLRKLRSTADGTNAQAEPPAASKK
jgi:hypothetical protein